MQQPPSQNAGGAAGELRSDAQHMSSAAADRLHSEVDSRKHGAADQAKSVSSAIRRTAGELDDGTPAWIRSSLQRGAEQIQRFADTIEQKDSRQLVRDVETFARERPGAFLIGCAAAGFAAARVLKAGGEPAYESGQARSQFRPDDEPGFRSSQAEPGFAPNATGEFV